MATMATTESLNSLGGAPGCYSNPPGHVPEAEATGANVGPDAAKDAVVETDDDATDQDAGATDSGAGATDSDSDELSKKKSRKEEKKSKKERKRKKKDKKKKRKKEKKKKRASDGDSSGNDGEGTGGKRAKTVGASGAGGAGGAGGGGGVAAGGGTDWYAALLASESTKMVGTTHASAVKVEYENVGNGHTARYVKKSTEEDRKDWKCLKPTCGISNFRKALQCKKCGAMRRLGRGDGTR